MNRDTRRTRVVLALLLLTSFTLISLDFRHTGTGGQTGLRGVADTIFGPLQRAAAAVTRPVATLVTDIKDYGGSQKLVSTLRQENDRLKLELRTSEAARKRAAELDSLLKIAGAGQYRIIPAQVIAVGSAQSFAWTVTIDAGQRDGIERNMSVIQGGGLVGRVVSVGPMSATVLLAIDPASTVGVRLEGSNQLATVTGQGKDGLRLQLETAQQPVAKGDGVVTWGSMNGRPYVPGLPVGQVESVAIAPGTATRVATVKPYVDFGALDLVGVVVAPPRTDPRDSLLPPKPAPSPTPGATPTPTPTP